MWCVGGYCTCLCTPGYYPGTARIPVYDIELSPDIYRLVLCIYYGSMHMIAILLSIATIILCLVMRKSVLGKPAAYFGFGVAELDLVGAFPWLIGTVVVLVCQLALAAWFVFVGVRMMRSAGQE